MRAFLHVLPLHNHDDGPEGWPLGLRRFLVLNKEFVMMHEASVAMLVDEATEYLRKVGYGEKSIEHHRCQWQKFVHYARKRKNQQPFLMLARHFLKLRPSVHGSRWDTNRKLQHSMRILMEFSATGQHRIKSALASTSLPVHFELAMDRALIFAEKECGWAKSTLIARRAWMRRFIRHLIDHRGIRKWEDILATDLPAYLGSLQIGRGSRGTIYCHIRVMFRILFSQGVLPTPLHELLPPFNRFCEAKLSTIWSPAETAALVASVDRSTALGKRDYAVLLLAMRLGLRSCDIRALRLDDIHWERSRIEIVQQKTHVPLALPLLPEVGEALIDYLRHGRPRGQFREVFLRRHAPCGPYQRCSFHRTMQTCCKKAGLPPKQGRMGLSSLRHTLATRMLEDGTGVETIAGALGHTQIETTRRYIRVDLPLLRQAALDPEKEVAYV